MKSPVGLYGCGKAWPPRGLPRAVLLHRPYRPGIVCACVYDCMALFNRLEIIFQTAMQTVSRFGLVVREDCFVLVTSPFMVFLRGRPELPSLRYMDYFVCDEGLDCANHSTNNRLYPQDRQYEQPSCLQLSHLFRSEIPLHPVPPHPIISRCVLSFPVSSNPTPSRSAVSPPIPTISRPIPSRPAPSANDAHYDPRTVGYPGLWTLRRPAPRAPGGSCR